MSPLFARIAVVVAGLALLAGLASCSRDDTGRAAGVGRDFLAAWSAGDSTGASRLTDEPAAAKAALEAVSDTLALSKVELAPGEPQQVDDGARVTLPFTAGLTLRGLGKWEYTGALPMVRTGDEGPWRVDWSPAVIHPKLTAATALRSQRSLPPRAPILDRAGAPLMSPRPVVDIGIWPAKLTDPRSVYDFLGAELDIDTAALALRVRKAKPDEFVSVITLRADAFAPVRDEVADLPGLVTQKGTRTLAPTREFARAVLGAVGPATAETLASAGPAAASDLVGSTGLQEEFQQQLAGTPGGAVELVDAKTRKVAATLHEFPARPGEPVRTTLDRKTQSAAEKALEETDQPAALVAIQPSTGEILAVANGPAESAGYNRAFVGRYPPGSTFKVVSTAALLADGLRANDTVACPQTAVVDGKRFQNQDEFSLGDVPFRTDFARSCNTAFVALAERLPRGALPGQAAAFGLGGKWEVGLGAFTGSVPEPATPVDRAASVIGQAKVEMSPLAMASVAATVQAGAFRQPTLLQDPAPKRFAPSAKVSPAVLAELRRLMRGVVTDGSGSALADLPGQPAAKTGTAEFGTDVPPRTHAWMIGFRGDLAFAALIEDGGSGGKDAGRVVSAFLSALRP